MISSDKKLMELVDSTYDAGVDIAQLAAAVPVLLKRIEALRGRIAKAILLFDGEGVVTDQLNEALAADERMAEGK